MSFSVFFTCKISNNNTKLIPLATLDSILSFARSGDEYLSENIILHCGHLSDNISEHLSDTISIEPKIYVDN